uniref:Portal n=1 Tax=Siphoviridae sp. ct1Eo1 TaxID=2825307 RepID=A0A8S5P4V8_9CAUD|nr:MAG TPA: portal [Siphoviridae sp. ct1Eo1]
MTITLQNKIASAAYRGPSSAPLNSQVGSMTVKQIIEAKNARQASGLQRILIPPARPRWMMPDLAWVTPEYIARVLDASLNGDCPEEEHALYDLMCRTWPRLVKNVTELKNAVCGLQWNVQDTEDLEEMKHLAERTRDGMKGNYREDGQGWRGTINGLLDGWFCGVTVREIDWEVRGCAHMPQAWLPRQTRKVHPRWYGWEAESGLFGMRSPGSDALGDFMPNKFLVAINNVSFGHPSGGALLRSLAWYWCAANFSADWLLNFAQIFGLPIRWATYDKSDPELKDIMESMLENMGSAAYAAAPTGCTLELKEPSNKGSDNPQNQMIEMADTACDLLILGQTLTSSPGEAGSRALGEVHYNVRSDIIDAAAGWLCEILNEQMLAAVYEYNGAPGNEDSSLPYFAPASKTVNDPNAAVDRIGKILDKGIPLSKSYVYETIEAPMPGYDEELFESQGDDKVYPKALALASMVANGLPVSQSWAYSYMGFPAPAEGEAVVTPPASGMGNPALMAKALDGMPAAAREYYMAELNKAATTL